MSATNFTPISLYYSSTAAAVPSAGNLVAGELALNTNDGKLYYKNSSGVVTLLAGATSGPAGGSTTQVQYNNAGVLAGITGATTNGTALTLVAPVLGTPASGTVTNLTGTASININGTVGATTPAAGAFTSLTASTTLTVTGAGSIQGLTVGLGAGAVSTNTAVGFQALANTSVGLNTVYGYQAGFSNTTANLNSYFGYQAGYTLSTGGECSAFGYQALKASTGANNNAFGGEALALNTTGGNNNAFGVGALGNNLTGSNNVAMGQSALNTNSSGGTNTAIGGNALSSNTTASYNTAVGYQAAYTSTTAIGITAVGYKALRNNTGSRNSAFGGGDETSYDAALGKNTTGTDNAAFSIGALANNTTGSNNTASGVAAMYLNTTASNNTAVGYQAGYTQTTQSGNTFFGYQAGYTHNTGGTIGAYNCFIGLQAGYLVTTGIKNTIIGGYNGNQGSLDIRTASNYIVLSDGDGNPRGVFDNSGNLLVGTNAILNGNVTKITALAASTTTGAANLVGPASFTGSICTFQSVTSAGTGWYLLNGQSGNGSSITTNNIFILGNGNIQNSNNSYGAMSDIKLKENIVDATPKLAQLNQVRIVNYNLKGDYEQHKQVGVIAQELEQIFPGMVEETPDRDAEGDDLGTTTKSVKYSVFVPMLIKAMQEQQAIITALTTRITALEAK